MSLGERLKQARREYQGKGLTQKQLADKASVSQQTINDIESGRNKGSTKLMQIAAALEVRSEWLASGRGPKKAQETIDISQVPEQVRPWISRLIDTASRGDIDQEGLKLLMNMLDGLIVIYRREGVRENKAESMGNVA